MGVQSIIHAAFRRKRFVPREDGPVSSDVTSYRTLTLQDLTLLGIGGTLGSGLFFLTGHAARELAGPAVIVSFAIAACACLPTAFSYAEMTSRLPNRGGAYAFVYATLGEWPAFLVGMCLTLEYGVSAAMVARAWAAYLADAITGLPPWMVGIDSDWSLLGAALMLAVTALLCAGLQRAKWVINISTIIYAFVALVIVAVGATEMRLDNLTPFAPFGAAGIASAASVVVFAYLGFDEIAIVSEEAIRPTQDVPIAILLSVLFVSALYIAAAFVLTGGVPYNAIDLDAPFSAALRSIGHPRIARLVAVGTILGLTNTALVGFAAQPRLFQAIARDSLLPQVLARSTRMSTVICGIFVACLALIIRTDALADVVAGGTTLAFLATNISLLLTRSRLHASSERVPWLILTYFVSNIAIALSARMSSWLSPQWIYSWCIPSVFFTVSLILGFILNREKFHNILRDGQNPKFLCPWVPLMPMAGILMSTLLLFQLPFNALFTLSSLLVAATLFYASFSVQNSENIRGANESLLRGLEDRF